MQAVDQRIHLSGLSFPGSGRTTAAGAEAPNWSGVRGQVASAPLAHAAASWRTCGFWRQMQTPPFRFPSEPLNPLEDGPL
jgi:hypothetical protein